MKIEKISFLADTVIRNVTILIIIAVGLQSMFSTSFIGRDVDEEGRSYATTMNILDNPWKHAFAFLLVLVLVTCFIFFFQRERFENYVWMNRSKIIKYMSVLVCIAGILWIVITSIAPVSDQSKVFRIAMQWRQNNFMAYSEGGYLFRYPFQTGIVLFYYVLSFIFGINNYIGAQLVNVVALVIIYYFLAQLVHFFWKEDKLIVSVAYIGVMLWVPFFFYITYQYGILPGMACSLGAVYSMTKYFEFRKYRYAFIAALSMGMATVLKMNCLIFAVAMSCFLVYDAVEIFFTCKKKLDKKWMDSLIFVAILFIGVWGCNYTVDCCAEKISGYEMPKGEAMLSWIVMGLSEAELGPGFYTGYINRIFVEKNYDTELINEASVEKIKELLGEMMEDPKGVGIPFFARKTAFQWNDPSFIGMDRTKDRNSAFVVPDYVRNIIEGKGCVCLYLYLNYIQTMIWAGTLLYLIRKNDKRNVYELIGLVIFLGGFLFHLIWESSASYTIPYFLLIIPYAIKGFIDVGRDIVSAIEVGRKDGLYTVLKINKKRYIVWAVSVIVGACVLFWFSEKGIFKKTLALDDGIKAERQFYHIVEEEKILKNGYYYISPLNAKDKIIIDSENKIDVVALENHGKKDEFRDKVLLQEINGKMELRFRNTEHVLGIETLEKKNLLVTYLDDELNLFFKNSDMIETEWVFREEENSIYYILYEDLALTFDGKKIFLENFEEKESQKWIVQ